MIIGSSEVSTAEPNVPEETASTPPAESEEDSSGADLRPITVEHVEILTGWASPIPALVAVSGTWPDLCAQLTAVSQTVVDDFQIEFEILATPAEPDCPPDYVGLPFALHIPLNWGQLPEGQYNVRVNGAETVLYVPVTPAQAAGEGEPLLGAQAIPANVTNVSEPLFPAVATPAAEPVTVTVDALQVNVGIGSPIPVHAAISAQWPSLCAQLATIEQQVLPFRFEINVAAYPGRSDCPPDYVGYGFGLEIPLNVVELPAGSYTVSVNGVETTFEVPVTGGTVEDETLPPAVDAAVSALANQLGVSASDVELLAFSEQTFGDSCLGLGGPAESCAAVLTPGWQVLLGVAGQTYEVRTDLNGGQVRIADPSSG
jgi:hypothetical protein